jgi:cysteine desulfurase/selenocysteine lyase
MNHVKLDSVRADFSMLQSSDSYRPPIYLDNAATTLKPKSVIKRISDFYAYEVANVHRGVHQLSGTATSNFEKVREDVAHFIGAENPEEIIFTKGTTESINLVASVLAHHGLGEGDEILLTEMEHHSNIVPWQMVAEKTGAKVRFVEIDDRGELRWASFVEQLGPQVKVLAITHCSNLLGTINNLKPYIEAAKSVGSLVLVDGAQGIAKEPVSVTDLGCDFYAFSAHKMYGPFGVGILYGKGELLRQLPPYQGGGGMIDLVSKEGSTFIEPPMRFEAGTPNVSGVIGFGAALKYFKDLQWDFIQSQEMNLSEYTLAKLSTIDGIKLVGQPTRRAPIFAFNIEGCHAQDVGALLDQQGIAVRTGHHCTQIILQRFGVSSLVRASFCFYNSKEEVDIFIEALEKVKELLL